MAANRIEWWAQKARKLAGYGDAIDSVLCILRSL